MGSDNGSNKPGPPTPEPPTPSGGTAPRWEPEASQRSLLMPLLTVFGSCAAMQVVGGAIAFAIFKLGHATYSAKVAAAVAAGQGATHAALVLVALTIRFVNFYPMRYKEKVMKGALREEIGKNMRSNPFIYKSVGASKETVLFENEGVTGMYNRANRSLTHMTENFGSVLAGLMLAGSCFPMPTLVCAAVFGVGRVMHQVGYSGGYGKHGGGFAVSLLSTLVLEGFCVVVALAATGLVHVSAPPSDSTEALEGRVHALEGLVEKLTTALAASQQQ